MDVSSGDVRRWVTVSISSVLSGKPTFNTWTTGRQLTTRSRWSRRSQPYKDFIFFETSPDKAGLVTSKTNKGEPLPKRTFLKSSQIRFGAELD